jgi:hypothetical protein
MNNLIHPAFVKALAVEPVARPRARARKERTTKRFAFARISQRRSARPAEATRPAAAKPAA